MNDHEEQLQDLFDKIGLNDTPDPKHRDALEKQLIESLGKSSPPHAHLRITSSHSRITRVAVAAIVAMVLIVPLTYGTHALVKRLTRGSYAYDEFTGPFRLDRDIAIKLETGTKQQPTVATFDSIRFFVEDGQIRGTLRYHVKSWLKHKWRVRVELRDDQDKSLRQTECVCISAGGEVNQARGQFRQCVHVCLGTADIVSSTQQFRVQLMEASAKEPVTPAPWVKSNILSVVYGRVTDANDSPIAGAVIQIRENARPGQTSIAAEDVLTDANGFYCFDQIRWPYKVSASVYESTVSDGAYRHQFRRFNGELTGTQCINFVFDPFPVGTASLSGYVTDSTGQAASRFIVDVRLKIDYGDNSIRNSYTYGTEKPFATSDGRFRMDGLPAGTYRVLIKPDPTDSDSAGGHVTLKFHECELQEGRNTTMVHQNQKRTLWYGRVQFPDGDPAVPELSKYKTYVIIQGSDHVKGLALGTVDGDGYFAAAMTDEQAQQLTSGQASLSVNIAEPGTYPIAGEDAFFFSAMAPKDLEKGTAFPAGLLSLDREQAGTVTIERPKVYYGRILYEDGRPAVPPAAPWSGAKVRIRLIDLQATAQRSFITGPYFYPDNEGYFVVYMTDKLLRRIRDGEIQMRIMHPSYIEERTSCPVGAYSAEELARDRDDVTAHTLAYAEMTAELKGLEHYVDSAYKMKTLKAALKRYTDDHDGAYPSAMEQLAPYEIDLKNIEYFRPVSTTTEPAPNEIVLGYDTGLLDETGTTHVLFLDGHIEFCRQRRLQILGIQSDTTVTTP